MNNNLAREYQQVEKLIEQKQYVNAIDILNSILENNSQEAYAYFLKGKAYCQRKRHKLALNSYETAFDLYTKEGNKKYRAYTFLEIHNSHLYFFNGKLQEATWARFKLLSVVKDLNIEDISKTDVLYPHVKQASNIPQETFNNMKSVFSSLPSICNTYFGLFGKLAGYGSRGKIQFYIAIFLFILTFSLPIVCMIWIVYSIAKFFEITILATLFYFFIASTIMKGLTSAISIFLRYKK